MISKFSYLFLLFLENIHIIPRYRKYFGGQILIKDYRGGMCIYISYGGRKTKTGLRKDEKEKRREREREKRERDRASRTR